MATKRANGEGNIRKVVKNGNTYWEARFTVDYDVLSGKQKQKSKYFKTQTEARKFINSRAYHVDENDLFEPKKITFGTWIDAWLDTFCNDIEYSTKELYSKMCRNHIKPALGWIKLAELSTLQIQMFYNELAKSGKKISKKDSKGKVTIRYEPLSSKSIKNIHGVMTKCLNQAVDIEYIKSNPALKAKINPARRKPIHPLDDDQVAQFIKAVKGDDYELIYKVILFTGMREGEALGLCWDCIDFENNTIRIEKQLQKRSEKDGGYMLTQSTKSHKTRVVTVAPYVMDIMKQRYIEQTKERFRAGQFWQGWQSSTERKTALCFNRELGEPISIRSFYNHYKKIAKKIGIPESRVHDLRHTYAVLSLQSGDDVKTVQDNLGHATASFTLDVYGHVSQKMKEQSAQRMQKYIQNIG